MVPVLRVALGKSASVRGFYECRSIAHSSHNFAAGLQYAFSASVNI
jgi:hypothetical protein